MALHQEVILDLAVGVISGDKQAVREFTRIVSEGTSKGAVKGMGDAQKSLSKTTALMFEAGMNKGVRPLNEAFQKGVREQKKTADQIRTMTLQIEKIKDDKEKKRLKRERDALVKQAKEQRKAQEKLLKDNEESARRIIQLREQHQERMNRSQIQALQDGGEKFQNIVESAMSLDSIDPKNLASSLTQGLAGALSARGGAAAAAGAGGSAAALATAAASLTAVAAPLAAIVGILAAAAGQATEMNQALMEGTSAIDMTSDGYLSLNGVLTRLRQTTIDVAYDLRIAKGEVTATVKALNDAGITVSQFNDVVSSTNDQVTAYRDITRTAILASKGLGISTSEVGEFMNRAFKDLGYSLDDMQGAFGLIYSEAQNAKMSTKDFFTSITSATSGMALYNFRIEETVGLFTQLVEILGEDLAKEKIGLEKQFAGMGMQERLKSTYTTGFGRSQGILRADMQAQAKEFERIFGQAINIDTLEQNFGALMEQFKDDADARKQLITMRRGAMGATGGRLDLAAGMGSLSKSGELAMQLSQAAALTGGTPISEMSGMQRMLFEEATGVSGEQFDILERLDIGLRETFDKMLKKQAAGDEELKNMPKDFVTALSGGHLTKAIGGEAQKAKFTEVEQAALDTLAETTSIRTTMENTIAFFLEKIWVATESIWNWISGTKDAGAAARDAEAKAFVEGVERRFGGDMLTAAQSRISGDPELLAKATGQMRWTASEMAGFDPKSLTESAKGRSVLEEVLAEDRERKDLETNLAEDQKFRDQYTQELMETGLKEVVDTYKKVYAEQEGQQLATLIGALQATGKVDAGTASTLVGTALGAQGTKNKKAAADQILAALGDVDPSIAAMFWAAGIPVGTTKPIETSPGRDFLYQRGKVMRIHSKDEFMMGKPEGPISQAGGGRGTVNITINGNDEARMYNVVKKALRETGYGDVRRYGSGG